MSPREKWDKLQTLLAQKSRLDAEINSLRAELKEDIKPSESIDGITHQTIDKRSVKYGQAVEVIINTLVPPSKKPKAWSIVEGLTTRSVVHTFLPTKGEPSGAIPEPEAEGE
jgi:hypothetical protein